MVTSEETRTIVSANLKKIVKKLGVTQGDIARRMFPNEEIEQKHRVQVSRWINGQVLPSSADIVNLAEILGVTVVDLLDSPKTKKFL